MTQHERIKRALSVALRYAHVDGARHKAWVIDQMVRALTGCPVEGFDVAAFGGIGDQLPPFHEARQLGSLEYKSFVRAVADGAPGDLFEWDVGVKP